jgi:hypothetical protein
MTTGQAIVFLLGCSLLVLLWIGYELQRLREDLRQRDRER